MTQPAVYFIVLNYNNASDTIDCVRSIEALNYTNYQIVLVDNLSKDDSAKVLQEHFPQYPFIQTGENQGYAAGNNVGIDYAMNQGAAYICILNNDVLVAPDFLDILVDYAETHGKVGVLGPRICTYEDAQVLESAGSVVNFNKGQVTRLYHQAKEEAVAGKVIPCDYVGGACMLLKTDVIREVGMIPENYFLFYEENEWCVTIKKAGYDIFCVADAKVIHKGSASINKVSGLSEYFMYRNLIVFMKRNGTLKNRLIFYPYILLFAIKSGFTKKNGWRFMGYFKDGITGANKYTGKL
ncbi:glycosyltransferase family 2 protein [Isobaculum melis]|uniref:Glycosyltransferase, GT2 family n=1 Tax=Isobaculum melis TaxID=142588 RepID=A0A1H9QNH5_9LACT|nr:glycosyltransferase family 2 protein [Isobaculum melis]SER62131.1 Glycosyltransferase, GT2 family [Isobaculum melis]